MKLLERLKRPFVFLLAVSLFAASLSFTGGAADGDQIKLIPATPVFRGKNLNAFGKTHHDMNIYYVSNPDGSLSDEVTVALCIQEGKKIPDFSPATYELYEVKPGQTVPVIGSFERYLAMTLAYSWLMLEGPFRVPERYGVVQVYYWGAMAGYEHNWAMQQQAMEKLSSVMNSPEVMTYYEELKAYIAQGEEEFSGTGNSSLPPWSGSSQKMTLKDGHYEITLDISVCPQLKDTVWTFPDGNWSYEISTDGNSITFIYNGSSVPTGVISSAELEGIEAKYYAYLFTPSAAANLQMQLGWLNLECPTATVSFQVGDGSAVPPAAPNWEILRHSETFDSNYNIDLEKYCAETNQPLESATFNVWEDFDFSQVNTGDYTEGSPDGSIGEVYLNRMSPAPERDYLCDAITTDTEGHASHSDVRYYNYSKLYCMGHPAPEWIECDHEGEEGEEAEECSCDEENERLRQQWMAEQELCASTCDFHVGNSDDENREKDASAMEAMLADRDETYENFIVLEYSYTVQERNARSGYTLHDKHNDDEPIETVILTSAQAGGGARAGNYGAGRLSGSIAERIYTSAQRLLEQRMYTYLLPEQWGQELDGQRSVIYVTQEAEKVILEEMPDKNEAGESGNETNGQESGENGDSDSKEEEVNGDSRDNTGEDSGIENSGSGDGSSGDVTGENDTDGDGGGEDSNNGDGGSENNSGGENSSSGNNGGGENTGGDDGSGDNTSGGGGSEDSNNGDGGNVNNSGGNSGGENSGSNNGGGDNTTGDGEGEDSNNGGRGDRDSSGGNNEGENSSNSNNERGDGVGGDGNSGGGYNSSGNNEERQIDAGPGQTIGQTPYKGRRERLSLTRPVATGNNAGHNMSNGESNEKTGDNPLEDAEDPPDIIEEYQYIRNPISPSFETEITFENQAPPSEEGNAILHFFVSLLSYEEGEDSISVSLPSIEDDTLMSMDVSSYGGPYENLYTFKVWNHRTEGRIHINKRDLELYKADKNGSYGLTQGDGTLEGAVYGLFAAQNIVHPDGKSGVIYGQNDLVAVAATDKKGDASFLACTEKPGTVLDIDGTIKTPTENRGAENLYNGSSIHSSSQGFGTVTYPNYLSDNGNQWIGRPLLMGNYYIMELSRSEGYELSVNGLNLTETNRSPDGIATIRESGSATVSGGLSDYNNMAADGSWNDFMVDRYKTENGYDIVVTGYPAGTKFYQIKVQSVTETVKDITGSSMEPKRDEHGSIVYQTAKGGEYKTDADGNPIIKTDTATGSGSHRQLPYGETLFYRFRTAPYPSGTGAPEDMSKWNQDIDEAYLKTQVNHMLEQIGYKAADGFAGAPWADIELTGVVNSQAATEIMDWFTSHNFFDCGAVEAVYQNGGHFYARVFYDYSGGSDQRPAVYDSVNRQLYVKKKAPVQGGPSDEVHYWIAYDNSDFRLSSKTVSIKEKRAIKGEITYGDRLEDMAEILYQPVYDTYAPGELLLDTRGNPIPVLERVYTYTDRVITYDKEIPEPLHCAYDNDTGAYTIHIANDRSWTGATRAVTDTFRAVTAQKTIEYQGRIMPYNQYLTDIEGAGVTAYSRIPALDGGSYIKTQLLAYPGQFRPVQDGGTQAKPVQTLQRSIKQSIKITKDISQASYDDVNTYGSLHNDPLTVFLGLFTGGGSARGAKTLNQFKFKLYLKSNLESIYVDDGGAILSEDIGREDFKGEVQRIFLPPRGQEGRRLLEAKEDGTYNYAKFFDAMNSADQTIRGVYPDEVLRQFAIAYWDVNEYKKEVLSANPELNSDAAYNKALNRAMEESAAYLDLFQGLSDRLSIAWDSDPGGGADGDKTTLQCNTKNGVDDYYNESIMLPYGAYVIAEQTPFDTGRELANRHYDKDYPKELTLPFVPDVSADGNTGETVVNSHIGSAYYRYDSTDTPEDLMGKYKIRFNEETHIIQAHGQDGDFEVFKFGLDKEARPGHSLSSAHPSESEYMDGRNDVVKDYYIGYASQSEDGGDMDGVVYYGYETPGGQMEVRNNVPTMTGMQTAVDGKYASMLVPWTILAPAVDRVNPDNGNVETLTPSGSGKDFNFVAYAHEDFEDAYFHSKLRIEKQDAETGDNIIHDGALFKLYAAKRDVEKTGTHAVTGTGDVLFGEAVDWEGNPVTDAGGIPILYPRVGRDNGSADDLPIRLDKEGIPQYDETQLIRQEDKEGNETGIFKAYSTCREVVMDGQIQKVPVGYIETCKPLGAGAYVLVEIQAPKGYTKSRPVAFEIYADATSYYEDRRETDKTASRWEPVTSARYQYAAPVVGTANKFQTGIVSQIKVKDYPSRMEIHKVEDGDSMVGNQNILQKTDAQGRWELSGGLTQDITVNDAGDRLLYRVEGRKEMLEERGDVRDITFDPETRSWYGFVTKTFDEYSEKIVEGEEKELKAMPNVKPFYQLDGTFTGKGIDFTISVSEARLSLYKAIELEKTGENQYKGVAVSMEEGKVTAIVNTNTGTHKEIGKTGQDTGPAGLDVWDVREVDNGSVNLFFYDLEAVSSWENPDTGEVAVMDERGNKLCYADSKTGMAYVYDDYGRMLAYTADSDGNKELARSIQVTNDESTATIYENKRTEDDENGLPVYYTGGNVTRKEESWITDDSTDPYGKPETSGGVHAITRLPFGAYILQEEMAPYSQGYIQSMYLGLILEDTGEVQKYFLQNGFTKIAVAKVDVRTQKEIQGASMTLYKAQLDEEGNPLTDERGLYLKGDVYTSWISGFQYDDNGNLKTDESNRPIPTSAPHWIDHIPVGYYVLEETSCPYNQGYVQSADVNIYVSETGDVQSFAMEDDFTALEIWKFDTNNEDTLYKDSEAWLTLYHACLDQVGLPLMEEGIPQYQESGKIFTFRAATYKDGQDVAATGRVVPDTGGNHPIIKYDYDYKPIPDTFQGRYYYTEKGTTRLEYLPVGSYVLVETGNPDAYATAKPVLITIEDRGHLEEIQHGEMGDQPLKLEVAKVNRPGGKIVNGAALAIYPTDSLGNVSSAPLTLHQPASDGSYQDITARWTSGLDGKYTREEEKAGKIPSGFAAGDLKPHIAEYIPEGHYILREESVPYGFLKADDVPFTIIDTQELQKVEMEDNIPRGILKLTKTDADRPGDRLKDVQFCLTNKTLNKICETVTTNAWGEALFKSQPIGYMDEEGNFKPYTYECREMKAAPGHMLTLKPYEFQFQYQDQNTPAILLEYNPANESNRVKSDKRLGDTGEWLEGATLRIERKTDEDTWQKVDEWVTGRQTHYTKDLEAGDYRLTEIKAPEGVEALAEPVFFTITDGMTSIPQMTMRNYTSIVEIQKTTTSGGLLAGARLRLIYKETGEIIREWTSQEDSGQTFYGLKPGIYIIREMEAPAGYKKGEDREITVNKADSSVQVFQFENRTSSGGGGGHNPKPEIEYIVFKKKDGSGMALPEAEFTFYDQTGGILGTSVSDNRGYFRIRKPEDGTYTFCETKAPQGYALNSQIYSFTISGGDVIRGNYEIINERLKVPVQKIDGVTGEFLSGARLCIRDKGESGETIGEGVTGENGSLIFHLPYPGTFIITETEAPDGYLLTEDVYEVTVSSDGQVSGNAIIYNFKEKPPAKTVGRITAVYRVKGRFGRGTYRFGPGRDSSVPTGDNTPLLQAAVAGLLCLAGFIICAVLGVKDKKRRGQADSGAGGKKGGGKKGKSGMKRRNLWLLLLVCLFTGIGEPVNTAAMEGQNQQAATPEPPETFYVSDQITYYRVERAELIPQRAWITAKDPVTGAQRQVTLPMTDYTFTNEQWEDNFQMEVDITGYGSDSILMGTKVAEENLEKDFSAWEEEILELAGLKSSRFRIEGANWKGEAYENQGELCRTLTVYGKRLVGDCIATYAGVVNREIFKREAVAELPGEEMIPGPVYDGSQRMVVMPAFPVILAGLAAGFILYYKRHKLWPLLKLAALLFLIGGIFCGAFLIKAGIVYERGQKVYREIRKAAYGEEGGVKMSVEQEAGGKDEKESGGDFPAIDESRLKALNPDYRLWLSIPGAGIEYPVVQSEDNQYYLTHDFNREDYIGGSIFLDYLIQPLTTDNTVIFGHNMKDGSMFGNLKQYREEAFYLENPYIRIFYRGLWLDCPVISCQLHSATDAGPYRKNFLKAEWPSYLEEMKAASLYPTNDSVADIDRIITLSTCYGGKQRLTVQAAAPDTKEER